MVKKKGKGFTLIELIAVLVIMAMLVLIVTPLVMSIVKKAKVSARKRSIDAYGRSIELAIAGYLLDNGTFPTDISQLTIEYSGDNVVCNVMQMKENGGVYLSECKLNNVDVKDSSTDDGWYHYGTRDLTNEDYVDMYGEALKNASLTYYTEHGIAVEDYRMLEIDYEGKDISCDVTVNYNGTIYMTNCNVNNKKVTDESQDDGYYHYGKDMIYQIGDIVLYNEVEYYVIEYSDNHNDQLKLLKAQPLTVEEVNLYGGAGTSNNHINVSTRNVGHAVNRNGYGGVAYYSSGNQCNYEYSRNCTGDYNSSDIKYIIDAYAIDKIGSNNLIEARIITMSDLLNNLGYIRNGSLASKTSDTPSWLLVNNENYWINDGYRIAVDANVYNAQVYDDVITVRPVIVLTKSAL